MAVVSIEAKKSDVILMSLGGMVSIPTAFLVSVSFRSFFALLTVIGLKEKISCFLLPSGMIFFLIRLTFQKII